MVEDASQLCRVVSDPTRVRILHLLRSGELCVGDLVTVLGVPQPAKGLRPLISRRSPLAGCQYSLAALRAAGTAMRTDKRVQNSRSGPHSGPTASRHLTALRKTGFITARKNSYWTFYALAPARTVLRRKLLECLDADVAGRSRDRKRLAAMRRNGGCCPM
jgi:DNA-binding transcriptional ArsR family regulator